MTRVTKYILMEVNAERDNQDVKWGEQNHPLADEWHVSTDAVAPAWMASRYHVPTATDAQANCDAHAKAGTLTWFDIAIEELCEAIEWAAKDDLGSAREELIQLAAVCVAAVESMDRAALS